MADLEHYREVIKRVLERYIGLKYLKAEIENKLVLDEERDHYSVISVGWMLGRRVHGCLLHLDIIDDKIWIQRDGTEHGVALDLEEEGIPKDKIVLGFHEPKVRPHTGYAAA
jgi:hypothetical protein